MAEKLVQLHDKDGNNIYPVTNFGAILGSQVIKDTFVQKSGDTMTGNLTAPTFIGSLQGNATTATKLGTSTIGSNIKPIYLNNGTATACSYELGANIKAYSGSLSSGGWAALNGKSNGSSITIAYNNSSANWNSATYSASLVFGCQDTRGLLDCAYSTPIVTFGGCSTGGSSNDSPTWYMKLSGTNGKTYTLPTDSKTLCASDGTNASGTWGINITGNATSATKATQDGNGNAITSTYLPLSGGTVSGTVQLNGTTMFTDRSQINKIDFSPLQTGAPPVLALALKNAGYALYNDEEFASGNNNCNVYNNNGNGTVTIQRVSDSTAANTSGYILKITSVGNATPGFGGFYQSTYARANAIYFQLFRAKIPVGYSVVTASNSMGSNYKDYWITNTAGTGRWEWYGRLTICGYTGSFSSGGHVYITGSPTPSSSAPLVWYIANCNTYDLTKGAYINATKVYGATWNDYAEFRSSDPVEPGRVICETGDGTLKLSTERLQPGANVVSDTFGFAIGETENCKTPIAVSGRALVYTYEDRYSYAAGDPVCAGPGGTVSKMNREEVMMYPDRIVGTVSEIPEYDHWGTGNVEVKNRIWIRIK